MLIFLVFSFGIFGASTFHGSEFSKHINAEFDGLIIQSSASPHFSPLERLLNNINFGGNVYAKDHQGSSVKNIPFKYEKVIAYLLYNFKCSIIPQIASPRFLKKRVLRI